MVVLTNSFKLVMFFPDYLIMYTTMFHIILNYKMYLKYI